MTTDTFNSGSGNWTNSSGQTLSVVVELWGASGGSGAGGAGSNAGAGGSGGGAYCKKTLSIPDGTSVPYSVGAAGSASTNIDGSTNGTDGGDSTITYSGTTYTAGGGKKGLSNADGGTGGAGGTATNGDLNYSGGAGANKVSHSGGGGGSSAGTGSAGNNASGTTAGSAPTGGFAGGNGGISGSTGTQGTAPGGGSGGGGKNAVGVAGRAGRISFTYTVTGTTYNITQTDSLSLTDSNNINLVLNPSQTDSLSLTESNNINLVLNPSQTDSLNLTETYSQTLVLNPSQTDSLSLTDSNNINLVLNTIDQTDSLNLTETYSQTLVVNPGQTDSLSLTDSNQYSQQEDISQTVSLTEDFIAIKNIIASISDNGLTLTNTIAESVEYTQDISDSILSDSVAIDILSFYADSIGLSDQNSVNLNYLESLVDDLSTSLNDNLIGQTIYTDSQNQSIGFGDTVTIFVGIFAENALVMIDSTAVITTYNEAPTQTIASVETFQGNIYTSLSVMDKTTGLSDSVELGWTIVSCTDNLTLTQSNSINNVYTVSDVSDSMSLTDVGLFNFIVLPVIDNLNSTQNLFIYFTLSLPITDTLILTDNFRYIIEESLTDSLTFTEIYSSIQLDIIDNLVVSQTIDAGRITSIPIIDTLTLVSAFNYNYINSQDLSDTLTIQDNSLSVYLFDLVNSISFSETLLQTEILGFTDSLSLSQTIDVNKIITESRTDTLTSTNTIALQSLLTDSIIQATNLNDLGTTLVPTVESLSDSLSLSINITSTYPVTITDTIGVSLTADVTVDITRTISQSMTMTQSSTINKIFTFDLSDTLVINDYANEDYITRIFIIDDIALTLTDSNVFNDIANFKFSNTLTLTNSIDQTWLSTANVYDYLNLLWHTDVAGVAIEMEICQLIDLTDSGNTVIEVAVIDTLDFELIETNGLEDTLVFSYQIDTNMDNESCVRIGGLAGDKETTSYLTFNDAVSLVGSIYSANVTDNIQLLNSFAGR